MIRLLGKAIALSTLASVLHFAEAADRVPIGSEVAATAAGSFLEHDGNERDAELAGAGHDDRRGVSGRNIELAPVLDDQLIPDEAEQDRRTMLA
jgi:branched-chain amino acid transport system substrate-binding protein